MFFSSFPFFFPFFVREVSQHTKQSSTARNHLILLSSAKSSSRSEMLFIIIQKKEEREEKVEKEREKAFFGRTKKEKIQWLVKILVTSFRRKIRNHDAASHVERVYNVTLLPSGQQKNGKRAGSLHERGSELALVVAAVLAVIDRGLIVDDLCSSVASASFSSSVGPDRRRPRAAQRRAGLDL